MEILATLDPNGGLQAILGLALLGLYAGGLALLFCIKDRISNRKDS